MPESVLYTHTKSLAQVLAQANISLAVSTYQAGMVVCIGSHRGELSLTTASFDQPMGLCKTAQGMAIATRDGVWQLVGSQDLARRHHPCGKHDLLLMARQFHHTGPIQGHDLSCDDRGRLWLVNTLFNGLVTIEAPWSFVPQWQPAFINDWIPGDRCHLNGLASDPKTGPQYVTCLSTSDELQGWRNDQQTGGCVIRVENHAVIADGLCMPHSPRLHNGGLYYLHSGPGELIRHNPTNPATVLAVLPGFSRGLDLHGNYAVVGYSKARDGADPSNVGARTRATMSCGVAIVNLATGRIDASLTFDSMITEIFGICILPGYHAPAILGPSPHLDGGRSIWWAPKPQ